MEGDHYLTTPDRIPIAGLRETLNAAMAKAFADPRTSAAAITLTREEAATLHDVLAAASGAESQ